MKTETRNYNQGRVKELIENSLYEADQNFHISFNSPPPYKFKEFDILPENKIFNDSESIFIKYYNTENGEVIAFCSIRERYLKLIQDGELSDRKHEYNLFKKYAEIFLVEKNKNITLSPFEINCAENCNCIECVGDNSGNISEFGDEVSKYNNPYYNDNLDSDQQSSEFWNNI